MEESDYNVSLLFEELNNRRQQIDVFLFLSQWWKLHMDLEM